MSFNDVLTRGEEFLDAYPRTSPLWNIASHSTCLFMITNAKLLLNLLYKPTIHNIHRLDNAMSRAKQQDRGIITIMNHMSVVDDPSFYATLPWRYHLSIDSIRWGFGAHNVCFSSPTLSWFFNFGKILGIKRFGIGPFQSSVDAAIRVLSPDDTRYLGGGETERGGGNIGGQKSTDLGRGEHHVKILPGNTESVATDMEIVTGIKGQRLAGDEGQRLSGMNGLAGDEGQRLSGMNGRLAGMNGRLAGDEGQRLAEVQTASEFPRAINPVEFQKLAESLPPREEDYSKISKMTDFWSVADSLTLEFNPFLKNNELKWHFEKEKNSVVLETPSDFTLNSISRVDEMLNGSSTTKNLRFSVGSIISKLNPFGTSENDILNTSSRSITKTLGLSLIGSLVSKLNPFSKTSNNIPENDKPSLNLSSSSSSSSPLASLIKPSPESTNLIMSKSPFIRSKTSWFHVFPEGFVLQLEPPHNNSMRYFKWGVTRLILESTKAPIVVPLFSHGFEKIAPEDKQDAGYERWLPLNMGAEVHIHIGEEIKDEVIEKFRDNWRSLVTKYIDPLNPNDLSEELKTGKEAKLLRSNLAAFLREAVLNVRENTGFFQPEDPRFKNPKFWKEFTTSEGLSNPDVKVRGKNWAIKRLQSHLPEYDPSE